jgi:hypothetical protein
MTSRGGPEAEAALWMLAQLDSDTQSKIRRRLALRLDPPVPAAVERQRELGLLAELLDSLASRPGWSFPCAPRAQYDSCRSAEFPSSAALVERYGSWVAVCRAAHDLATGNANRVRTRRERSKAGRRYSKGDAIAALHECARELNRTPSSTAYRSWSPAAERRRRGTVGYPSDRAISRLYSERGGWLAALEDADLVQPPAMTVRVVTASKQKAIDLATVIRAAGLLATQAGNRNWLETRGTLTETRSTIRDCSATVGVTDLTLWEPLAMILERVDLKNGQTVRGLYKHRL